METCPPDASTLGPQPAAPRGAGQDGDGISEFLVRPIQGLPEHPVVHGCTAQRLAVLPGLARLAVLQRGLKVRDGPVENGLDHGVPINQVRVRPTRDTEGGGIAIMYLAGPAGRGNLRPYRCACGTEGRGSGYVGPRAPVRPITHPRSR